MERSHSGLRAVDQSQEILGENLRLTDRLPAGVVDGRMDAEHRMRARRGPAQLETAAAALRWLLPGTWSGSSPRLDVAQLGDNGFPRGIVRRGRRDGIPEVCRRMYLAGGLGFEPRLTESESALHIDF
jgi:hypothetical protein